MTKPTSVLHWSADPLHSRRIWLRWIGASWNYTIAWGDGTTTNMAHWQPPVRHDYAEQGTYTVICTPDMPGGVPIREQVTVRGFLRPEITPSLEGNVLTLTAPDVASPVRWRANWGDNTVTEHGERQFSHTYRWGFGVPTISVVDAPSKRGTTFEGPEIGPPPRPVEYQGFCVEHVETTEGYWRFRLHGGGLAPGEHVLIYPYDHHWDRTVVADARGEIHETVDMTRPRWDDWQRVWRSFTVQHQGAVTHVPVHGTSMEAGTPEITYQVDPTNTRRLTFSVFPPQLGEHHIQWGDGSSETVIVTRLPLLAEHTYGGTGREFVVTVTLPDGRTVERTVVGSHPCPPCFVEANPGQCDTCWWTTGNWCGTCGQDGGEPYSPVEITMDHGPYNVLRIHKPAEGSSWHCTYVWRGMVAGTYTFTYVTAFAPPQQHTVTIAQAAKIRTAPVIAEATKADTLSELTAWFGEIKEWDGGYSGKFHVHNHAGESVARWAIEFTLSDPAVLREVWPSSARFTELSGNRWRIYSTKPLPGRQGAVVGARIEPPGKARKWPDGITARPWTSTEAEQ